MCDYASFLDCPDAITLGLRNHGRLVEVPVPKNNLHTRGDVAKYPSYNSRRVWPNFRPAMPNLIHF